MSRRKPKESQRGHFATLAPPELEDVANQKWYRWGSDISQAAAPSEFDDEEEEEVDDGRPQRAQWTNQMEFLMSCIATSVGLGNVWRFPFVAYQNGGGAFLIPYIIVLFIVGKPMYYLECILGQFSSRNSVRVWSLCPAMKGVGYAQTLGCAYILSYYVMIIALCLYYLVMSFRPVLPWSTCDPGWDHCVPSDISKFNGTPPKNSSSSAELYFVNVVLQQSEGVEGVLAMPIWYLCLALFISWLIIFLIVAQGVKSSGKAAYFLALFPYVVMIILLITTMTLPGSGQGILYLFKPHWERILQIDVWYAAVTQAFFSLSVCIGAIIMFSSYNGFRHNIYRDSMIVTTLDTLTSLLSGITIFGILGNLAYNLGAGVDEVVGSGGTGLAFISYPDAIAKTVQPQLFAVMFFLMMAVLGVGSAVALLSTINTVLLDAFPNVRTIYTSACSCTGGFIIGLVYTTPGGQFVLELVDYYGGTFLVLFSAIVEVIGIFWIYGLEEFCLDVEYMLDKKPTKYWRLSWALLTPALMMIVFLYSLWRFDSLTVGGSYHYPPAGYAAGYIMFGLGMIMVPIFILKAMYRNKTGKCVETMKNTFISKKTWGPRSQTELRKWKAFKDNAKTQHLKGIKHICMSLCGKYNTHPDGNTVSMVKQTTNENAKPTSQNPLLGEMSNTNASKGRTERPGPSLRERVNMNQPSNVGSRRPSMTQNQESSLSQNRRLSLSPNQEPSVRPNIRPNQDPSQDSDRRTNQSQSNNQQNSQSNNQQNQNQGPQSNQDQN